MPYTDESRRKSLDIRRAKQAETDAAAVRMIQSRIVTRFRCGDCGEDNAHIEAGLVWAAACRKCGSRARKKWTLQDFADDLDGLVDPPRGGAWTPTAVYRIMKRHNLR